MAEATKKPAAKSAAKAKPAAKSAAAKPAKAAKAIDPNAPKCSVEKCKQPVRAKGYCRKHYFGWRRGEVGKHHRYKVCAKEACRARRAPGSGSFCVEHGKKSGEAAAA